MQSHYTDHRVSVILVMPGNIATSINGVSHLSREKQSPNPPRQPALAAVISVTLLIVIVTGIFGIGIFI